MPLTRFVLRRTLVLVTFGSLAAGCIGGQLVERSTDRYARDDLDEALSNPDAKAGLVLGDFPLAPNAVVDGDTIKVGGLDASLRLLGIDTEETFKSEKDLRAYETLGFAAYLEQKRGDSDRPPKAATPMGMEAKHFAEDFFRGVNRVRIERDHPKEIRGRYNRLLSYVFVERDGEWINYNVECVRAGMSPYFTKYGYSRRFHDQFVEAQDEARAAERGIWDPQKEHYPDYDERLRWWNGRAEFIEAFERQAADRPDHIVLTHWDALDRLEAAEGDEVWLLGAVGEIRPSKGTAPTRVLLGRRMFSDFPLIFFDERVFAHSGIADSVGEFVVVRGTVSTYTFRRKRGEKPDEGDTQLQIVVRRPEQIVAANKGPQLPAKGVAGGFADDSFIDSKPQSDAEAKDDMRPTEPEASEPAPPPEPSESTSPSDSPEPAPQPTESEPAPSAVPPPPPAPPGGP